MVIRPRYHPYPVLAPYTDDYIDSTFEMTNLDYGRSFHDILIKIDLLNTNDELHNLVKSGKAEYIVHVECPRTSYRKTFSSVSLKQEIKVSEKNLNGKVEICCFIVSLVDNPSFRNVSFHPDYEGISFSVEAGNYLAISNHGDIFIEKDTDDLAEVSSIVRIVSVADNKEVVYTLDTDKIKILLPAADYRNYISATHGLKRVLHAMIVYPAITYAFEELAKESSRDYERYQDNTWFQSLRLQLEKMGISLNASFSFELENEPHRLAQKLLDFPIHEALNELLNSEGDDD